MALPTSIQAPRHRSADERLAEQLGGEQERRKLVAAISAALALGGKTLVEFESDAGKDGRLFRAPVLLHGGPVR